jgi:hypothetical protein
VLGGVKIGSNINVLSDGTISVAAPYILPIASSSVLGGIKVGSGLSIAVDGTLSTTTVGGVTSITVPGPAILSGALTLEAGPSISIANTGNTIQISGTGVPYPASDNNLYGMKNNVWTVIPDVGSAITSLTSQSGAGAVLLLETQTNPNAAVVKSLVAGTNVQLTEAGGLITVNAAIPGGTVSSVNGKTPDPAGAVTLTPSDIGAVNKAGDTMTGVLDMGLNKLTGLFSPTGDRDAVNLGFIKGIIINGGVIG